ncbi:hypothetical protein PHMEG_0005807 [Phytophthora megakarya]|uniref:Integrase zinc-binding domain-containing protein n=1 Tax=Phytophthora megakarya TaxID=4795 RepID=A0A225WQJ9_9STRA|nr:hypothetical protein PHMEG_0005807 [Phytophthora megakarya]
MTSWEHAGLAEWHREWERYVEKMKHRCSTTGETYENVVATVNGSVRRQILKTIAKCVLKKSITSVTDADIMGAVETRYRTLKNEFVPDVTSLFHANVWRNLHIGDCDAQSIRYYGDFNGIVEDNGLQGLIGSDDETDPEPERKNRMKAHCRLLPPVLKAEIRRLIELEQRNCKSDDVALFDLILEQAKVQQRFHRMSQDHAGRAGVNASKPERRSQKAIGAKPGLSVTPRTTSTPPGNAAARTERQQTGAPPTDGFLICKGRDWLKDCPTAPDAQRGEGLRQYREAKAQKTGGVRSKATRCEVSSRTVRINGLLEMPYTRDTAADQSIVPQEMLNSLLAIQPTLQVTKLPAAVEAVMANGQTQICDVGVLLDLELTTMAAGDGDKFLLGHEVLKGLGIDVEQPFSQLANSPLFQDEVDEFLVGDEILRPADTAEPTNPLDLLLGLAVSNGLPQEHIKAVRGLLAAFPDVWREGVGPDPPADVEPLRVTIRPDAPTKEVCTPASQVHPRLRAVPRCKPFGGAEYTVTIAGCPWIPAAAKELLARIFIIAHCGAHGHRRQEQIGLVISERFCIARLEDKVAIFVRECLLCKRFKGPRLIPRPY